MRRFVGLLVTAVWTVALPNLLHAGDWASWRGPQQNGVSLESPLVDDWSLDGKNLVLKGPVGGRATPIVLNGKIYLNCRTYPKDKIDLGEEVICRDAKTGKIEWRDKFNVFQTDIPAPRVGWASMVGDTETGNVYVHTVSGIFRCYTGDGKVVWEHSLFEEYGKISGYGGRTHTPIVDEDRVIVSYLCRNWGEFKGPAPKHRYFAFNKKTGDLLWVAEPGGAPKDTTYSCPVVAVIDGIRMIIGGNGDGGVHGFNARTGKKIWSHVISKRGINCSPVVDAKNNLVYITHGEDNIDNTEFGRVECIKVSASGKVESVWRKDSIKAHFCSPALHDGILYIINDKGKLLAFDAKAGDILWEYALGTVGKGSPVWADGKIYAMEVNGRIHILKVDREGAKKLSEVTVPAREEGGNDEIYASPAISNGLIYFVTRDRTICIGDVNAKINDPSPPGLLPETKPESPKLSFLQVAPYEIVAKPGEKVTFKVMGFNQNGQPMGEQKATFAVKDLSTAKVDGGTVSFENPKAGEAGHVVATVGDLTAAARVRIFPKEGLSFDFTGLKGIAVPKGWIGADIVVKPKDLDGETVLSKIAGGKGRPSGTIWVGDPNMKNYVVQADVMTDEKRRQLGDIGVAAHRYTFALMGNDQEARVYSWTAERRMSKAVDFDIQKKTWYTVKLQVEIKNGHAIIKGKAWERDKKEPEKWTIEVTDPNPNEKGAPGIYFYNLADCFFDNVKVSEIKQ